MLAKAIALAAQSFEHIKDKGGKPYILHCLWVMNDLKSDDEELNTIAVLHDWVEDMFKNNPERGLELLISAGFSHRVIRAIDILTHREGVPYEDYIKLISTNEDATRVKKSDLKHNSDITRLKGLRKKDFERLEKYQRAFVYLSN